MRTIKHKKTTYISVIASLFMLLAPTQLQNVIVPDTVPAPELLFLSFWTGTAAKEIVNEVLSQSEQQKLPKEKQDELAAITAAVTKMVEEVLKKTIEFTYRQTTGSSPQKARSLANAFSAGLKLASLIKLGAPIKKLALDIFQFINPKPNYTYDFKPIRTYHTTSVYCGPKDQHCLHETTAPQLSFIDALASTINLMPPSLKHYIEGISATIIGQKVATSYDLLIQKTLASLLEIIKTMVPEITPDTITIDPIINKGLTRYITTKTFYTLRNTLMDLIRGTTLTPERLKEETEMLTGSKLYMAEQSTLPIYTKLIGDFLAASKNTPRA